MEYDIVISMLFYILLNNCTVC